MKISEKLEIELFCDYHFLLFKSFYVVPEQHPYEQVLRYVAVLPSELQIYIGKIKCFIFIS